jgi:hypothetical protein
LGNNEIETPAMRGSFSMSLVIKGSLFSITYREVRSFSNGIFSPKVLSEAHILPQERERMVDRKRERGERYPFRWKKGVYLSYLPEWIAVQLG